MTVKNVLTLLTGSCLIGGVMAKDLPQVLLLGDSVRIGYQKEAEARLAGAAQVKYPSVNCGSSEDLRRNLETYMEGVNPALVCLNAGLVDIHADGSGKNRVDLERYLENLKNITGRIRAINPAAKIIFVSTTPVDEEKEPKPPVRRNSDIERYNAAVKSQLDDVEYLDLHALVEKEGIANYFSDYGTGLNSRGREEFGKVIADAIRPLLPKPERKAVDPTLPQVLLLGDSIRINYQPVVTAQLAKLANIIAPDENCRGTVFSKKRLDIWTEGANPRIIWFNMGLHDIYLPDEKNCAVPPEEYRANLEFIAGFLRRKFPQAKIFFALTTPVNEASQKTSATYGRLVRRNSDVLAYNGIARDVMKKYDITVADIHAFVMPEMLQPDGIHLNSTGQKAVGKYIAEKLKKQLENAD